VRVRARVGVGGGGGGEGGRAISGGKKQRRRKDEFIEKETQTYGVGGWGEPFLLLSCRGQLKGIIIEV
jgi:hypothetical protein